MATSIINTRVAVKITTSDNRTIPEINMVDGVIKFITNIGAGESLTYEDTTAATGYTEGYLIDKPVNGLSNKIDLTMGGTFATLNNCTVTIDNSTLYASNLLSNGVYLTNAKIEIFVVLDEVLYARYGGVISEINYNEKYVVFTASDVNKDNFSLIPESDTSQIVLGGPIYTPLKSIGDGTEYISKTFTGHQYKRLSDGTFRLTLVVDEETYLEHKDTPNLLANYYLRPRVFGDVIEEGATDDSIRIVSNLVATRNITAIDGAAESVYCYYLMVYLEHPFEDINQAMMVGAEGLFTADTAVNSEFMFNADTYQERVLFDLIKFTNETVISKDQIDNIELNEDGEPILYAYDEDLEDYVVADAAYEYTNDADGAKVILRQNSDDIVTKNYSTINFTSAQFRFLDDIQGEIVDNELHFTAFNDTRGWYDGSELIDGDYTTMPNPSGAAEPLPFRSQYFVNESGVVTGANLGVICKLQLPDDFDYAAYDEVSLSLGLQTFAKNGYNAANDDVSLLFRTLDQVKQEYEYGESGVVSTISKLVMKPITTSKLALTRAGDTEAGESEVMYTQILEDVDSTLEVSPPKETKVVFSPKDYDNATVPSGAKYAWGGSYTLETTPTATYNVLNKEQSITEALTIDKNPVIEENGNKYIYMWIAGDPRESDITKSFLTLFWVYNMNLIGTNTVSSERLFVKATGEAIRRETLPFSSDRIFTYSPYTQPISSIDYFLFGYGAMVFNPDDSARVNLSYDVKGDGGQLLDFTEIDTIYVKYEHALGGTDYTSTSGFYLGSKADFLIYMETNGYVRATNGTVTTGGSVDYSSSNFAVVEATITLTNQTASTADFSLVVNTRDENGLNTDSFNFVNTINTDAVVRFMGWFDDLNNKNLVIDNLVINGSGYDNVSFGVPYPDEIPTTSVYGAFKYLLEEKNSFTNVEYTNVEDRRGNWDCGRVINTQISTKNLLQQLAQNSFTALFTNRYGNLQLNCFKDYADYEYDSEGGFYYWTWLEGASAYTFDTDSIIKGSIKNVKRTNLTNICNNISLNYNFNYATNSFLDNDKYFVTNVDKASFPAAGADYSDYSNISDYTLAKMLWDTAHNTYVTNNINKNLDTKTNYRDCLWYNSNTNLLDSSITYYISNLIEWVTQSKNEISFSVKMDSTNVKIQLCDRITFSDVLVTDDNDVLGWVTGVNTDVENAKIDLVITTVPTELIPIYKFLDESSATILDQVDEQPASSDTVDEQFVL